MTDRPEDRPEERRRRGPLGDDADAEETRQVPTNEGGSGPARGETFGRSEDEGAPETRRIPQGSADGNGEKDTRVIRTPGSGYPDTTADATPYPRGYFEAAEDREDRLRDMYGGVDWLASFLGFVFALIAGAIFSVVAGIVLGPLGFTPDLGGQIGAAVITGLVLLGVLIFLTFFFGGYVAGRLARFDGGRNGAMLLVWTVLAGFLLVLAASVFSSFLPEAAAQNIGNFVESATSAMGDLAQSGIVGIAVVVGALLFALLGGFLGGRLGSRYHAEIDRAT